MKYFVTGATGFVGGRLVDALLERGHEVVAIVRTPAKAQHLVDKGVEIAPGDITDKDSMRNPMSGVDGVFHVAAWYKIGEKDDGAYQINVDGSRNVFELMKELNIPKGVYTSTLAVYGDTKGDYRSEDDTLNPATTHFDSVYDKTKSQAHFDVALPMMKAGLPLVIVQPGPIYGAGDNSSFANNLRDYLKGTMSMIPGGLKLCFAHVDDVVEGHILAMEKGTPGESYIICGECESFVNLMNLLEEITGYPAPKTVAPPALLKGIANITALINALIPLSGTYHPETLRVFAGTTYLGDNSKAKRELGYNPRSLREGMTETINALIDEPGLPRKK